MCGLQSHSKPDEKDMHKALERWIPGFKATKLSKPINVGFTLLLASAAANPPRSRSSKPAQPHSPVLYDTSTGKVKPFDKPQALIQKSSQEVFYTMQQLFIANEPVLTFFDTGSNAHIVDGAFAERVGFQVLDDSCTRIGVIGGGDIWSEYGVYSCILGPDVENCYHKLEC
jgi:hypothetical protein